MGCFSGTCGDSDGDLLSDLRGESLMDDEMTIGEDSGDDPGVIIGLANAFRDVILGAQSSVVTVFTGAQDTAGEVMLGAQDTAGELVVSGQAATERILNPFGLFGAAAGLTFGGALAVTGLVGGAALIVDEVATGGAGRTALARRVFGRGRR